MSPVVVKPTDIASDIAEKGSGSRGWLGVTGSAQRLILIRSFRGGDFRKSATKAAKFCTKCEPGDLVAEG